MPSTHQAAGPPSSGPLRGIGSGVLAAFGCVPLRRTALRTKRLSKPRSRCCVARKKTFSRPACLAEPHGKRRFPGDGREPCYGLPISTFRGEIYPSPFSTTHGRSTVNDEAPRCFLSSEKPSGARGPLFHQVNTRKHRVFMKLSANRPGLLLSSRQQLASGRPIHTLAGL